MSSKKTRPTVKRSDKGKSRLSGPAAGEKDHAAAIAEQARSKDKPSVQRDQVPKILTRRPTRKLGGLTAAYQVLNAAKEPKRCAEIVTESIKRGLWSTDGKTPAATIHAAIIREIATKGKEARFRKVGRGLFAANNSSAR